MMCLLALCMSHSGPAFTGLVGGRLTRQLGFPGHDVGMVDIIVPTAAVICLPIPSGPQLYSPSTCRPHVYGASQYAVRDHLDVVGELVTSPVGMDVWRGTLGEQATYNLLPRSKQVRQCVPGRFQSLWSYGQC
ncbi:hypothetical protein PAXRUDRAFT_829957 [Paxillus rubicundulus Ve08.2h10]|uniref:Secreted protein n=1 Tax=Paxillus rubicundulus Ve08.2h10 TaxID=930991 RepID=A0A0D0DU85_9AGAM|nr:hypothetical protein PAXRUDRAFT_829957 [Paxillus rubicundulus Ve08.2h10]